MHVCACHSDESFESFDSYVSYVSYVSQVSYVSYVYVCFCSIRKQDSSLSRYLFKIKDDKTHQKHNINKKHKKHKNHGLFLSLQATASAADPFNFDTAGWLWLVGWLSWLSCLTGLAG